MKKKSLPFLWKATCITFVGVLTVGYAWYYFAVPTGPVPVRVGFVLAHNVYAHRKAYEGFLRKHSQVEKKRVYDVRPFYFKEDEPTSLVSVVKELRRWKPDVVVVDGYFATPYVAREMSDYPVVFIGVDDCVERKLVDSFERPGGHVTGVISGEYDRLAMAAMLQVVKPGACNVLLPYDLNDDVGGLVVRDARAVKRLLAREKVNTTIFPISDMAHALEEIAPLLQSHDVLLTLECDPLEYLIEPLVALCEKTETTFFPGSLGGMEAGAMFAFGGHAQVPGKMAFVLVQKIVEEGVLPAELPIAQVTGHRQFVINASKAAVQHMQPVNEQAVRLRLLRYNSSAPFELNLKIV
ncbi:MAG: putative tryptophan/tyrosine transport system substrate-binding protein [Candidatus Dependentiae bacterium]|nr:putative tryptophan/tyrosine transport system substrate-binding protein [Candidatus Dependentiae bacterium]